MDDKFYLTEGEKNAFLAEIASGKDVVIINGMAFTRFFKYLVKSVRWEDTVPNINSLPLGEN